MSDFEEKVIEVLKKKRVLKMIVSEIAVDPELRHFLLQSLLPNVATKDDIRELRRELRSEILANRNSINMLLNEIHQARHEIISYVEGRISDLDKRIDALDKRIDALDKRISLLQWLMILMLSLMMFVLARVITI